MEEQNPPIPLIVVPGSIALYTVLSQILTRKNVFSTHPRPSQARNNAISAGHAVLTTAAVLYALASSPIIENHIHTRRPPLSDGNLDDSSNPLIQDRNAFANLITTWETGYLIYDTWMLVQDAKTNRNARRKNALVDQVLCAARQKPDIFAHHTLLASAFLVLQGYIFRGREKGIWVIMVFMLFNASNPVMHARWWARSSGQSYTRGKKLAWDIAFAVMFGAARFGTVAWLFKRYGTYHGMGAVEVFGKLRVPCRVGTAALTGLNALWWTNLVKGIMFKKR
ncbi:TRAM/LAG1/CLN8 homology domain-containing protein [Clohesyomyces aquaticus]|uniref:TRAM/LAG1/CLN8 homology domain-containing protein n=1 Tax=Clohesyomyces aquaticus TaxID=1231657 RepID=A0A1Y1YL44_9PLEO|nr:TRAM/LAG1/CLN8 homology domain-containing protein [Clohesyomyces aquaticus]